MKLEYETAGQWSGNIGKQTWNHVNGPSPVGLRSYTFTYDGLARLKTATYSGQGSENYGIPNINYNRNGNITHLQRNGKKGGSFGLMDNLTYTYSGNRLTSVNDAVSGEYEVDFVKRGGGGYTYHQNGALKSDENERITNITYNTYLNLPEEITLSDGRWIRYTYDGDGSLIKTQYNTGEVWEYVDGFVFKNGQPYQYEITDGRAIFESGVWKLEFDYKDHLGNTRASFKEGSMGVVQTAKSDFDPWGVRLNGTGAVNAFENRWEQQGKEKEMTFNLNRINFGARVYNPTIGRWDKVDPLADHPNQLAISPYASSNNDPVNQIDSDGRIPIPLITGGIGAIGGLVYGLVKGKSWKETAALTAGGFVAGATMGFGSAGIAALGGVEAIGGAGATMITLGSGVAGGLLGNATEQGVKIALGTESSFNGNELILNGAFGMSEVVLGPAAEAVSGAAKNAVQSGLSDMFKPASRAEIRSTQRELSKQIRGNAPPGSISKSEANKAAKQLINAAQEQRANTLQGTIKVSNGVVNVSVSAIQTTISEETKNKINNQ